MENKRRVSTSDFVFGEEEKNAINDVIKSNRISEWKKVTQFEHEWAKYIGTKYSISVNSGTSALVTGLIALKYAKYISDNDPILTTPLTYIATSNAIMMSNMQPAYVDVDINTFGITPENIKIYLEENPDKIKSILLVHLMGYPVDMEKINNLAKKYGITVIEDCAQCHGSKFDDGTKTGSKSLISCFSFNMAHAIQAGELGTVNTNNQEIAELAMKIKSNGRVCTCEICTRPKGFCPKLTNNLDPRFTHDVIGHNFKVTEFQPALGLVRLRKIDETIKKRQENVKCLNEGLQEFSDILQLPIYSNKVSYIAYPLVIKKQIQREKLRRLLEQEGIETRPLFGCVPTRQPAYSFLKSQYKDKLPNAEYLDSNAFYIGCHEYLSREDIDYTIHAFKKCLNELTK
ncbi:MAG: DegT/DnrJ/EryC1/StrS family aminotransferase [Nanoarchaeota archaeon]|nr:DegT/DnrJ/EryC1/StrS family aminotransferase [Nanoarchaeota archaeon]